MSEVVHTSPTIGSNVEEVRTLDELGFFSWFSLMLLSDSTLYRSLAFLIAIY